MTNYNKTNNLYIFRRDLRLVDNRGLYEACLNARKLYLLFIFDREILEEFSDKNDRRITFIYNSLIDINKELEKKGGGLIVKYGKSQDVIAEIVKEYKIQAVYCNHDYEKKAVQREDNWKALLKKLSIDFFSYKDHVIFEKKEIVKDNNEAYTVFTPYMNKWKKEYFNNKNIFYPSFEMLDGLIVKEKSGWLDINQIGYNLVNYKFPSKDMNIDIVRNYHKTRDFPFLEGTSKLGIHLRFGTVSIRQVVKKAVELNEIWFKELIWREFFMQIMWNFPHVDDGNFKKKYHHINWINDEKAFIRWTQAKTGYPIIDAGIRELLSTGYMHNRIRMISANFLTKILMIDWQWGERFFAEHLIDYELSSNNGNWQWAAGTGADASPYFRIFNPFAQVKKYDPNMLYINKWLSKEDLKTKALIDYDFARKRYLSIFKDF